MVDIPQQFESEEERIRTSFEGLIREMWFSFPVSVTEDSDGKTVKLQPSVKGHVRDENNKVTQVDLPVLDTVPIHFVSGGANDKGQGGWSLTHPIKKGDEGMVIISSRGIDNWFEKGGTQEAIDHRFHHLSDAKFIPGLRSKPRQLKNISTSTVQLRSDDEGGDKKPKHVIDFDHSNGKITTSVDSGKHVTIVDQTAGISHESSIHVNVKAPSIHHDAPKLSSKGTWQHDGGFKASEVVQAGEGFKAPKIDSAPGSVKDVT